MADQCIAEKCTHHREIVVQIKYLQKSMSDIKKMFWAIILGLVLVLAGLAGNHYTLKNGHGMKVIAGEYEK